MDSLFKPPPFGAVPPGPSALSAAALPKNMPLWDLFRNIGECPLHEWHIGDMIISDHSSNINPMSGAALAEIMPLWDLFRNIVRMSE